MKYQCLPYIMRFNRYVESPYKESYVNIARWCNQPSFFKKKSYREFCELNQKYVKKECAAMRCMKLIEKDMPKLAKKYFDLKFEDYKK